MLSALAAIGRGLAAAQGDLPDQPPGRSWQSGRFLLVSLRTNARAIPRARLDTRAPRTMPFVALIAVSAAPFYLFSACFPRRGLHPHAAAIRSSVTRRRML